MEDSKYKLYWFDCEVTLNLGLIVKALSEERARTWVEDSAKFRNEFIDFIIEYLQDERECRGENLESFKIVNSEKYTVWKEEKLDRVDVFVEK